MLSGNRNFEGRVNADVRANYLASPPLVVAYAIAGSMNVDLAKEPLGTDQKGKKVFLKDIWPIEQGNRRVRRQERHPADVRQEIRRRVQGRRQLAQDHRQGRHDLRLGQERRPTCRTRLISRAWRSSRAPLEDIVDARVLALFLDSITTDHISPAGSIKDATRRPANICVDHKVKPADFNQYGTRRGNHEVMMRGTFANIRIKNQMVPGVEGGFTMHYPVEAAHDDLRRGHEIQSRERAAGRVRRQGIRHRLLARLGGQGLGAARHPRRGHASRSSASTAPT